MMDTGRKAKYVWFTVGGIALAVAGLVLLRNAGDNEGIMQVLPFFCIGFGCGAFGWGAGELLRVRALKNHPELALELEIEQQDERRIYIANAAKARAFDVMNVLLAALIVCFGLMQVELVVLLLLVAVYLLIEGVAIYQMVKLDKKL